MILCCGVPVFKISQLVFDAPVFGCPLTRVDLHVPRCCRYSGFAGTCPRQYSLPEPHHRNARSRDWHAKYPASVANATSSIATGHNGYGRLQRCWICVAVLQSSAAANLRRWVWSGPSAHIRLATDSDGSAVRFSRSDHSCPVPFDAGLHSSDPVPCPAGLRRSRCER
jgi:hypothetical protein